MYRIGNGAKGTNLLGVYDSLKVLEMSMSNIHFSDNHKYILLKIEEHEDSLEDVLVDLKVDINTQGGIFIRDSIVEALNDPTTIEKLTTYLYPLLGKRYSCNHYAVERVMRRTIEKSWKIIPEDIKARIFGDFSMEDHRPTNRAYLRCILQYLR